MFSKGMLVCSFGQGYSLYLFLSSSEVCASAKKPARSIKPDGSPCNGNLAKRLDELMSEHL